MPHRAASDFAEMDFPTRDRYWQTIEELARGSANPELVVARRAIAATKARSGLDFPDWLKRLSPERFVGAQSP